MKNGIAIFKINKAAIVKGEKTVMKFLRKVGLKLLRLAIFPVPKKARRTREIRRKALCHSLGENWPWISGIKFKF